MLHPTDEKVHLTETKRRQAIRQVALEPDGFSLKLNRWLEEAFTWLN